MRKYLLAGLLFLSGCGYVPLKPNPWNAPPRYIHVIITVDKYSRGECLDAGGTFVVGDTRGILNALVGCIEPEKQ